MKNLTKYKIHGPYLGGVGVRRLLDRLESDLASRSFDSLTLLLSLSLSRDDLSLDLLEDGEPRLSRSFSLFFSASSLSTSLTFIVSRNFSISLEISFSIFFVKGNNRFILRCYSNFRRTSSALGLFGDITSPRYIS